MARIALDIDSTLHHYWDLFREVVRRRHGLDLPYELQRTWGVAELPREAVAACVAETHTEANILAPEPYPGAVEAVSEWHARGHWIHITSHRATSCHDATQRWLDRVGIPFDDLHCSYDKVTRCVELDIDLLVDDSPTNLVRARERGMAVATIVHPWNEELVASDGVVGAKDWPTLQARIDALIS